MSPIVYREQNRKAQQAHFLKSLPGISRRNSNDL